METISQTEEQELEELLLQEMEEDAEQTQEQELRESFELQEEAEEQVELSTEVPPDIIEQFGEGNWEFDQQDIRRYKFDFEKKEQFDEDGVSLTQTLREDTENPFIGMHEDIIASWSVGEAAYIPYTQETESGIEQYVTKSWVEADGTVVSVTWKRELEKQELEDFNEEEHTELILNEEEDGTARLEFVEEQEEAHEDILFVENRAEAVEVENHEEMEEEIHEEMEEVVETSQVTDEIFEFVGVEQIIEEPRAVENIVTEPFPDQKKEVEEQDETEPLTVAEPEEQEEYSQEIKSFEETGISIVEVDKSEIKTKEIEARTTDKTENTEEIVEKQKEEIKIEKTAEETGISIVESEESEFMIKETVRTADTTDEQMNTDEAAETGTRTTESPEKTEFTEREKEKLKEKVEENIKEIVEIKSEIKLVPDTKEDESVQEKPRHAPEERGIKRVEGETESKPIERQHETPRTVPQEKPQPQRAEIQTTNEVQEIRFTPLNIEAEKITITRVESSFVKTSEDKKEEPIQKEIIVEQKVRTTESTDKTEHTEEAAEKQKEKIKLEKEESSFVKATEGKMEKIIENKKEENFEEKLERKSTENFRKIDIQKPIHIKMNNNGNRRISGAEIINRLFGYKPQALVDDEGSIIETNNLRHSAAATRN